MLPAVGAIPGVGSLGGLTSTVKSVASGSGVTGTGVTGTGVTESASANSTLPSESAASELEPGSSVQGAVETPGIELEPSLGGEAGTGAGSSGEGGGFGEALTSAISSLDQTQQNATGAAQALATGGTTDPESAVATVEEAQMAMDLASQIRAKATEAIQGVFQTQV